MNICCSAHLHFAPAANVYADRIALVLINGDELTRLMAHYGRLAWMRLRDERPLALVLSFFKGEN